MGADAAGIARAVCGLQAQSFDAARHQLRVRGTGVTAAAVDGAFAEERTIVRTWLMRGTLHLCAADDVRWLVETLGPVIDRLGAARRANLGLDDATCRRGLAVIRKALAHGPMARRELRKRLVTAGVLEEPVGQALIHLLFHAAAFGVICCGPRMGNDDSFVLLDDWVAKSDGPHGAAGLAELARRYLSAYGPASAADFAAWSGLRITVARVAMADIAKELVEFPGPTGDLWSLGPIAGDGATATPVVRLLGHFDTFLLGYRLRLHMGDSAAEAWIHDGGGGWIRPVICVDGWITGGWRLDQRSSGVDVTVMPFGRVPKRAEPGIRREVAAIGSFLERPARWSSGPLVGFNSPPT
jgi:hypothetical protein